ncbi:DALR anticodon-binding domain-containing protein [Kitasatospora sp. NPDC001574]
MIPAVHQGLALESAERALGLLLDEFGATIDLVTGTFEPHHLCAYLHSLASAYTTFYEHCPVLKAPSREIQETRLLLCQLTGQTLRQGMNLLGIGTPKRL